MSLTKGYWPCSVAAGDGFPCAKIVSGTFNIVRVAVAPLKARSAVAQAKLAEIVKEAKRTGVKRPSNGLA